MSLVQFRKHIHPCRIVYSKNRSYNCTENWKLNSSGTKVFSAFQKFPDVADIADQNKNVIGFKKQNIVTDMEFKENGAHPLLQL